MKINFNLDERKISKESRNKIYDLGQISTTLQDLLNNSEITITDNLIPIISVTNTDDIISYYLLPDLKYDYSNISRRNTLNILETDLIPLSGSSSSGGSGTTPTLQEVLDTGNISSTGFNINLSPTDNTTSVSNIFSVHSNIIGSGSNLSDSQLTFFSPIPGDFTTYSSNYFGKTENSKNTTVLFETPSGMNDIFIPDKSGTLLVSTDLPKTYRATITQTGTSAPTTNILQNTVAPGLTWLRDAVGTYRLNLTGAFPEIKRFLPIFPNDNNGVVNYLPVTNTVAEVISGYYTMYFGSEDDLFLLTVDETFTPIEMEDLFFTSRLPVEFYIYN